MMGGEGGYYIASSIITYSSYWYNDFIQPGAHNPGYGLLIQQKLFWLVRL